MKKEIKWRFDTIANFGCIVCLMQYGAVTQPSIHHLTGIKFRGMGKKADDINTIALCHFHHQGEMGLHRIGMRPWEKMFGTQEYLLEITNNMIAIRH